MAWSKGRRAMAPRRGERGDPMGIPLT